MTIPFSVVVDNLYFLCRAISSIESRSDIDRFTLAAANLIRSFGASARFWRVPRSVPVSHLVVPLSPFVPSELTSMRDRLEFVGSFGIYWKGLESLRTRQSADFRNGGTHADCQPGLPVLRAGRGCVKKRSIGALSIDRIVWNCAAPGHAHQTTIEVTSTHSKAGRGFSSPPILDGGFGETVGAGFRAPACRSRRPPLIPPCGHPADC